MCTYSISYIQHPFLTTNVVSTYIVTSINTAIVYQYQYNTKNIEYI